MTRARATLQALFVLDQYPAKVKGATCAELDYDVVRAP